VDTPISALLNLLEDEDRHVSTLAMEQLLALDSDVDQLIAELQESDNPVLRGRIHQLGSILRLRRSRQRFIDSVRDTGTDLWDGIIEINYQFNPRMNRREVTGLVDEFAVRLPRRLSTHRLAAFMRKEKFCVTSEDLLGPDLYLAEDVLLQRVGAPILLSVVAQRIGRFRNWDASLVLHKGRHCLLDGNYHLISPAENWRVTRLTNEDKLHPCGDRDVWFTILAQLFLSAVQEGRLQAIWRVGSILAQLCDGEFHDLPFPLGS
jgi:hypothetical protein